VSRGGARKGAGRKVSGKKPAPFDTLGVWSVVLPCGTRIVGDGPSYLIVRPTGEVQTLIGVKRLMWIAEDLS
jgi:hypothetical protein